MTLLYPTLVCLLNTLIVHSLLTRKKTLLFCFVAFVVNTFLIICAVSLAQKYITQPIILKYITYSIAFTYIIYFHIVFKESLSKKTFTMFSIWMFSTIILFLTTSIISMFSSIFDEKYIQDTVYIVRICIQILFLPAVYYRLSKPYKKVLGIVPDKTINFMSLYPVIAFLLLINTYTTPFGGFTNFNSKNEMFLLLIFISLGYFLVFAGISSSSKMISLKYDYKIIENQVDLQRQNYKKLNESIEQINTLKHDVRHHLSAIKSMLQEKKYEQALKYVEQFNQNELSKNVSTVCNNFAADSIIKYFMSLAISKNIDFKCDVVIPEDIGINPLDLCVVLGNCLENAIEACDKLDIGTEKQIELISKIVGTHIVFMIRNDFNGNIFKEENVIKTSKTDPTHGIGLSSISETVNKYNGNLDIKYTDDKFEITIIMCTSARKNGTVPG
ncbi:MAG: sensor histidine kinase [Ignavibacteriales bacterium]